MRARSLVHLSDGILVRELKALAGREREATAAVVAHLAEVDARKLYLPAGYPSMHAWCVGELGMSEDATYRRITAARAARKVPALIEALTDGRLHLSGIGLLAPYLTRENAGAVIRGAARKSKREIELFLAQKFPRTEMLPMVQRVRPSTDVQLVPGRVQIETVRAAAAVRPRATEPGMDVGARANQLVPGRVQNETVRDRSRTTPIALERFKVEFTIGQATHDKLEHARALLSHSIPAGDLAQVLDRVLDLAIAKLEKQKLAKTSKPRAARPRPSTNPRYVSAQVKRAVYERDRGRCTFVSESGKRCDARCRLEFDHATPVAKGGAATAANIRLRCRAHNQYEAERVFGSGFVEEKRACTRQTTQRRPTSDSDLIACLRNLGFRSREVRHAAEFCGAHSRAALEERVKLALSWLRPKRCAYTRRVPPPLQGVSGR